jgi:hypothetical protein
LPTSSLFQKQPRLVSISTLADLKNMGWAAALGVLPPQANSEPLLQGDPT